MHTTGVFVPAALFDIFGILDVILRVLFSASDFGRLSKLNL